MNDRSPPKRYEIARSTILLDRAMNHFIKVGGISIIAAVFGIFIFIFWQVLPLFRGAHVTPLRTIALPASSYVAIGADEWTELPFALAPDGSLTFVDTKNGDAVSAPTNALPADAVPSALAYLPSRQQVVVGTTSGTVALLAIRYEATFESEQRVVRATLDHSPFFALGAAGQPIRLVHAGLSDSDGLILALQDREGRTECHALQFSQRRALTGKVRWTENGHHDLTGLIPGRPVRAIVNTRMDSVLVVTDDQMVHYLFVQDGEFFLRQTFRPFNPVGESIASADFLFGDDSVVFTSDQGRNVIFSLYAQGGDNTRLYGKTKDFPVLPGPAVARATSLRNKAFALATPGLLSLRYSTTEAVRWEAPVDYQVHALALGGKYDHLLALDDQSRLHLYALSDHHPEASWRAFFGKIWYEGFRAPKYEWQSTGGTDDFEPKLSMVPLIIGTLKGTLYAMLFSIPLALMAALYTSQFAHPDFKRWIKPTMEIMASLPSVILGFLSALWLAPLMENRVPSFLLLLVMVPGFAAGFGYAWSHLPFDLRRRIPSGWEFIAIVPVLAVGAWLAWILGPWLEGLLFVGRDLSTGLPIADFRLWWTQVVGLPFEQRNSLVVGFMMGFAVIPIIFTIAEDALSNVPPAFRSASLALGASRWQTAIGVILPTASAGIFSAIMIGFGRAVGETMIVLMATGNTPIMDFNIFSGMRTLSANIAVELPEAPHHSTLFRSLYLGALLLFMLTFFVNTLAEMLRHRLREKFKAV